MTFEELTRDERSLLLYLETRAVDYSGRVNQQHLNDEDRAKLKLWNEAGFIRYGRIYSKDLSTNGSHWVQLSDKAIDLAHEARTCRIVNGWENRRYQTTEEKRSA